MRITMQSIHKNILGNLNKLTSDMNRINTQISSGKQISRISENPVGLVTSLGLRTSLTQITQYQSNLSFGDKTITAAENSLTQMKDLASRAKVLAIQMANGSMSPENRLSAAEEVQHLFESAITLSNNSVNGKYIFGGFRTTGYTETEPTPFIQDARDGYFVNGSKPAQMAGALSSQTQIGNTQDIFPGDLLINGIDVANAYKQPRVTGTIPLAATGTDLVAGDFLLDGLDIGDVDLTSWTDQNGLNMEGAEALKTAINSTAGTDASAQLTTLYEGSPTRAGGVTTDLSFELNGVKISFTTSGSSQIQVAQDTVAAINAHSTETGVTAAVGNTSNGGTDNTRVVLQNLQPGNESDLVISNLVESSGSSTGLAAGTHSVDATHNTGQITIISTPAGTTITTSAVGVDDSILDLVGLGGGLLTTGDIAGDGQLTLPPLGIDLSPAATDGINMASAANFAQALNDSNVSLQTGVTAKLTTLSAGGATTVPAAPNPGDTTEVLFLLNGVPISLSIDDTGTATDAAAATVSAINTVTDQTGISARVGDGTNGGAADAVVLYNTLTGDDSDIKITGYSETGASTTGLADVNQAVGANNNTGTISLFSANSFTLSSNNYNDDTILDLLGLGGGNLGFADNANDGILTYGSTLAAGDLQVNGIEIITSADGVSDVYQDISAMAKAEAINNKTSQTGVTAQIVPAMVTAAGPAEIGSMGPEDLTINGIDIFSQTTAITSEDSSNALLNAINAKTAQTGVKAGRDSDGKIMLSTIDGRNLHIQTSAIGEKITQLNGGDAPQDQVYFGGLHLWRANEFFMNSGTTPVGSTTNFETGFAALGLAGGTTITGQTGDIADDGTISVNTITYENGYVRYAGDRENDFAVKIGQQSTIEVSKNGMSAVMETGIFTVLKNLADALRGQNYTTLNGTAKALDTNSPLNSGTTGLTLEDELQNGSFDIVVSTHDTSPPTPLSSVTINIDIANDSLADIAARINGVPGISSSWSEDGHLQINSIDPSRYTFALSNDSSNFLRATGSDTDNVQVSNISKSMSDLDDLMLNLTTQISDFGARANRIIVQQQIYSNIELSTKENLSEQEDTDLTEALMALKAKELAYEAALSAAAKTMQLSLVDYLK